MLHKTLEAKATTTDLGEFTALAATYSVDRMNERILPGAFKSTIAAWQESGKQIPLHWDHMGDAKNIIGTVDPASMEETAKGLQVKGQLDLEESDVARDAWRLMKKNAVALSFGYLVTSDGKAEDGVRELKSVDLFEITITPAPANPDTRFIDLKSQTGAPWMTRDEVEAAKANLVERPTDAPEWDVDDDKAKFAEEIKERNETEKAALKAMVDLTQKQALLDPDKIQLAPGVVIEGTELEGAQKGDLKAVWTASYVNDLPDSAFLYVESGGTKDEEGKTTPRSLRHFPVKDASGNVDLPHLRNALARIPQSNLPQDVKDRLTSKAQAMLDSMKSIEDRGEEPEEAKLPQDPLIEYHDDTVFELTTRGVTIGQPVAEKKVEPPEPPPPVPTLEELEGRLRGIEVDILTRGEAI